MIARPHLAGFTLIEVVVALAVSGMAVAAAAALLDSLGTRAKAIERAAADVDSNANAERLLRQLVANITGSRDSNPSFEGDAEAAHFRSWCETPQGWLDNCSAQLRFERHRDGTTLRLLLVGADSDAIDLDRVFENGRLRYLVNAESQGTWTDRWTRPGLPEAVAVILDADTLLLPVRGSYP
jgi:prepilin-type N-terminal cleavage/methylation domain-containing protein